jgi:3-oxoacyl-[acyl-carrier-protein] synthase III
MKKACIIGLGSYLPERVLSNSDLEKMVDTTNEWIISRTGITERRLAREDEFPSDMGFFAATKAIESCGINPLEIDLILVATMTPDYISPSTASFIQAKLGAVNAAAFDIQAACSGFIYGLSIAKAYIESGMYRHVLFIASEKMSAFIDYTDRGTCVIFGDGAAAAVIAAGNKGLSIDTISLGADGELAELVSIRGGGARLPASEDTIKNKEHYFKMVGNEVFKHAVRRMSHAAKTCLSIQGLSETDISWLVPHQANKRIIDAIAKNFEISDERVYKTIQKYGNTSAASIGITLDELMREQEVKAGDHILLIAFGGGLTWGAAVLTKKG